MDNQDILERIKALVDEEHLLREGSLQAGTGAPNILRLQQVEEQLDQCWDLLRQRRAKKDYGENPDEAEVRPVSEVEGYQLAPGHDLTDRLAMQIALLGDVMLGRLVNRHLAMARPAYPWGDTLEVIRQADLRIANLECVLASGGEPEPGKIFTFRSDPKNVACLLAAGIDVVSLANNHVLDFGRDAFREMLPALDARAILHAGAGLNLDAARRPAVRRVGTTAVGFIAFTDNQPDWEAGATDPGIHYVPVESFPVNDDSVMDDGGRSGAARLADLLDLVRRTKSRVQLLIVSAHWGGNWGYDVPSRHQNLARDLIDAGADVVFGHSPHVFRGVGIHRNRPIIFSAGDFVDDYAVDPVERNDQSFVFMLETEGSEPRTLRLHPTIIDGYQVRLARGAAPDIAARMQRLSRQLGTRSGWNASGRCLEIPLDKPAGV